MTGMLIGMTYTDEQRLALADIVRRARVDKGLDKEPAARAADVNSITWKRVEDAENVRDASLTKILNSLNLPSADILLSTKEEQLGRGFGDAPLVAGRKFRPSQLVTTLVMSLQERATLAGVRHKLAAAEADITDHEKQLLTTFLENEELRTLHARIDWLPREEQLLVSTYVDELHLGVEERLEPGYNKPQALHNQPNPLPYDGYSPDTLPEDLEDENDLETAPEQNASTAVDENKEDLDGPQVGTPMPVPRPGGEAAGLDRANEG